MALSPGTRIGAYDIPALVMEFVDGATLAERIANGALPLDEALEIARQIADALEAAHEQGILHRDLKPGNIKVRSDIYRRRINQTRVDERLTSEGRNAAPTGFSPDGKFLAYVAADPLTGADIWVLTLPTAESPTPSARPFVKTQFSDTGGIFSPDGGWIAFQSNESGRFEVYIRSFPDGERTERISTDGGIEPRRARTGQIFYRGLDGKMMVADVKTSAQLEVGKPRELFDARFYENDFGVAPDGKQLLMMPLLQGDQSVRQVHVILNFLSELRAKVH
jgi:hypothetical protein